jgi:cold shock protein
MTVFGALRLLFPSRAALSKWCRESGSSWKEINMPTGTVKFFNASKGYGFIQPEGGGSDAFVHISAVERSGLISLSENQRLTYDLEQDRRGKMSAVNLKSAGEAEETEPTDAGQDEPETAQQDPTQQDLEESKA